MPDVLGYIHTVSAALLTDDTSCQNLAIVIVGCYSGLTLQNDKGFVLVGMVVHRNKSTRLQGIQETVTFVIKTLVEVVVLSQSWRFLGFFHNTTNQLLVYYLHIY